jgi:hypothetical protein
MRASASDAGNAQVSDATRLDDAEIGMIRDSGYFLGHSSVWLMCAQALAVFDISKRVENGVEITPEINLVGETIVHQAPFKCSIKPRSVEAERLIRQESPLREQTSNRTTGIHTYANHQ